MTGSFDFSFLLASTFDFILHYNQFNKSPWVIWVLVTQVIFVDRAYKL